MQTYILSLGKAYINTYQGLSKSCWRGILLSLIESTFMGIFYFLSHYFVNTLHLNVSAAGLIISCYGLGAVVGGYLSGKLSDKTSPHVITAWSLFIQSISCLALIKFKIQFLLMLNLFVLGAATYGFITSNYVWVLNQCKDHDSQKIKAINLLSTVSNLGLALSAIIISSLPEYDFQYIFISSSVVLFLLGCYLALQNTYSTQAGHPAIIRSKSDKPIIIKSTSDQLTIYYLILTCVFFVGMIISQSSTTYSIFLQHKFPELDIKAASILFSINSILVVLLGNPIGSFFGKYNKILMVGVGGFLVGFGMMILNFSYVFAIAIVACLIYTLGQILFFCMVQYVCYQAGAETKKGSTLGMFRTVYASSRVVGPFLGGNIYSHLGGDMVWYFSGIIGIFCLISCYIFKSE